MWAPNGPNWLCAVAMGMRVCGGQVLTKTVTGQIAIIIMINASYQGVLPLWDGIWLQLDSWQLAAINLMHVDDRSSNWFAIAVVPAVVKVQNCRARTMDSYNVCLLNSITTDKSQQKAFKVGIELHGQLTSTDTECGQQSAQDPFGTVYPSVLFATLPAPAVKHHF